MRDSSDVVAHIADTGEEDTARDLECSVDPPDDLVETKPLPNGEVAEVSDVSLGEED